PCSGPVPVQSTACASTQTRTSARSSLPAGFRTPLEGAGARRRGVRDPSQITKSPWRCNVPEANPLTYEIALTHFIVSEDVGRSRHFYTEVLGGKTARSGEPSYISLANSWIIINVGGGPTDDKPTVTLETPRDPGRTSSFLNIRVSDIQAVYADW